MEKKPPEQAKDTDCTTVLTLTFEDKASAEAVAAIFNAACKSGKLGARARVSEVKAPEPN